MKIALVHDYIKEYGGAEGVLETFSDIFPTADIYTTLYQPNFLGPHASRLKKKWANRIHTSFFQHIPFVEKLISPLRLISPLAFKSFDFSNYDLIITSATGAYFPNSLNKKNAKLICYCHTPPRYLYGYPTARVVTNKYLLFFIDIINHVLRLLDSKYSENVDQYIANSQEVSSRIQKFYRRDSIVIYPPVDLPSPQNSKFQISNSKLYLTGGRLAHAKRFDLVISAAIKLDLNLKVFGRDFANNESHLKSLAKNHKNIEFLGEITNQEKYNLLQQATAFINPGANEDFGIANPEALSCGCPVIAHNSGGPKETIISGKTGLLFDTLTTTGLTQAILDFQKLKISRQDCITQGNKFATSIFIEKIKKLVASQTSK